MKAQKLNVSKVGKMLIMIPVYILLVLEGAITGKNDPWKRMIDWVNQ